MYRHRGTAAKSNFESIQSAQKKLIKLLFKFDYLTPINKIYEDTKQWNI